MSIKSSKNLKNIIFIKKDKLKRSVFYEQTRIGHSENFAGGLPRFARGARRHARQGGGGSLRRRCGDGAPRRHRQIYRHREQRGVGGRARAGAHRGEGLSAEVQRVRRDRRGDLPLRRGHELLLNERRVRPCRVH